MAVDTRAAAALAIAGVLEGGSLNQLLPAALASVSERDRGLLQQLCYGTLRYYPRLRPQLGLLLSKPLKNRDRDIEALLLLGLYQLEETRIPDHAAVAATVAATRALHKVWAKGLCNAVLRSYQREREKLDRKLSPAAIAAHPAWLFSALQQDWPARADAIMAANNEQPPMVLRVNRRQGSRDAYLEALAAAGIPASAGKLASDAVYLQQSVDVSALPGFADGRVSVQDEAAQLAAHLLQPRAGERVLDACAAPGGKACHLLELEPGIALTAMDVDASRLDRVRDNLQRLSLQADVVQGNAAAPPATLLAGSFDRILVDAPCSATGVIRRHPDIKLLRRTEDIAALGKQQLWILQGLWPLLRPGGTLLYVTCSVLEAENSAVLERFLATTGDAALLSVPLPGEQRSCGVQLLPQSGGPDGLFFSLLQRRP
ncbi:MAG: 16S rRNA (cytosine(967)-C(5))-methyltransferase RsmB [Haliea sp.]|uniref:16S rRNA (cytosine(967)-C(5))-methyltransferase RsmB n=1 Tax=Haliea sp. TaxID=1932666 RepID=UPI0032EB8745